jgi:hypothetical protein
VTSDYSAEELVRLNSHELTAHLLVMERRERAEDFERHGHAMQTLIQQLQESHRIGLRVLAARKAGRKMVRIADLIESDHQGQDETFSDARLTT